MLKPSTHQPEKRAAQCSPARSRGPREVPQLRFVGWTQRSGVLGRPPIKI